MAFGILSHRIDLSDICKLFALKLYVDINWCVGLNYPKKSKLDNKINKWQDVKSEHLKLS